MALPSDKQKAEEPRREGSPEKPARGLRVRELEATAVAINTPPLAHWSDRAVASIVDTIVGLTPLMVALLIGASSSPDVARNVLYITLAFGILLSLAIFFAQIWFEGATGQTLGKKLLGLVVINRQDALTLGFELALKRNLMKMVLDVLPLGYGAKVVAQDRQWHRSNGDQAVNSVVTYDKRRAVVEQEEEAA